MIRSRVDAGTPPSTCAQPTTGARTIILVALLTRGNNSAALSPAIAATRRDWLTPAAAFFALAVVIHNSDHLRRGVDAAGRDVFWLGTAGIAIEVAVVVLICQRHRLAPLFATVAGFQFTVGYLAVHFAPAHPYFSDSFTSASHVSPLSWFAASLEVVAALTLATAGLVTMQQRTGDRRDAHPDTGQRPFREAMLQPLALGFALSQVVILAVSFIQLG